jgi:hypothetical protein
MRPFAVNGPLREPSVWADPDYVFVLVCGSRRGCGRFVHGNGAGRSWSMLGADAGRCSPAQARGARRFGSSTPKARANNSRKRPGRRDPGCSALLPCLISGSIAVYAGESSGSALHFKSGPVWHGCEPASLCAVWVVPLLKLLPPPQKGQYGRTGRALFGPMLSRLQQR